MLVTKRRMDLRTAGFMHFFTVRVKLEIGISVSVILVLALGKIARVMILLGFWRSLTKAPERKAPHARRVGRAYGLLSEDD